MAIIHWMKKLIHYQHRILIVRCIQRKDKMYDLEPDPILITSEKILKF